ncbi:arsenite efflux transporter metallochaperone ArsD [Streptomyces sp. NPDC056956]|uniref:arsenite efflux transporter metallochaperone ArsD n=1 Tax=Streptomyces sp. NPDC056956 TaxID=3345980 RepID=UPI0036428F43
MTTTIEVFDPAMCCSTGVCGPTVEPHLARFAADLRWVGEQGATVTRHNLGQEPGEFATRPIVAGVLQSGGEEALPVILINGRLKWTGHYPTRDELAAEAGVLPAAASPAPTELKVIGADDACCSPAEQSDGAGGCC